MTITITQVSGTELYNRYPQQTSPQDCYVELDCEAETLSAEANPEIGNAIPFSVYHGRTLRWSIPALRADAANALLAEIAPLAERVCAGYECEWDGNNHVGRLDDDATAAREEIERLCSQDRDEHETVSVWDAAEWFGPLGSRSTQAVELGITAATTDDELAEIVRRERDNADGEHVDEIEGLATYLSGLRETAREESNES